MSQLSVYAIKDDLVGFCTRAETLILFHNDAEAVRSVKAMMQNPPLGYQDMSLYRLGVLDQNTGEITGKPEFVVKASALLSIKKENEDE